jgi:chromate reductase
MTEPLSIAVLVGSLRKESISRKVAEAPARLSKGGFSYGIVEIGALPLFNQDLEGGAEPAAWTEFRHKVRATRGVLFVTPEYNRSVPGALKNAIDVGSRPYGHSVWFGKPAGIISVSPGALGAFGANHHLRQSLVFLNMPTLAQPEAYIGNAGQLVADDFTIAADATRNFLASFIAAFEAWVLLNQPHA